MLKDIKFQFYSSNIRRIRAKGLINLSQFIKLTKEPTSKIKRIFNLIAKAEKEENFKVKAQLKKNYLYCFTPCVLVKEVRAYHSIKEFTGLMVLDYDHVFDPFVLKNLLFQLKFMFCVYLSPSKKGVKAILRIPICKSIEEFKEYYFGLLPYIETYTGLDKTTSNCVLPLFLSYDKDILYRDNPTVFNKKGVNPNPFIPIDVTGLVKVIPENYQVKRVINNFKSALSKIVDNGHPQLRSASRVLGGYCISGYITDTEAKQLVEYEVLNHPYFQKDVKNYLRTAFKFLEEGKRMPLKL